MRIIPQARAGVVERFGRYDCTLTPGLAILVPALNSHAPAVNSHAPAVNSDPRAANADRPGLT